MFYNHEILTSRKYGVATVWLVATLGAKSTSSKKVTRKAIQGVDVQKACETVMEPGAPMALRLQSNLLYGISRVYDQQCLYVLYDAQQAQNSMRVLTKALRTNELDLDATKARPERLMIEDDPAFLPEEALPALDWDFSNLDMNPKGNSQRSTQSMMSIRHRSGSINSNAGSILGLNLPSSSGIDGYGLPFNDPLGESSDTKALGGTGRDLDREEVLIYEDDMIFDFDADGELRDIPDSERGARRAGSAHPKRHRESDSAATRLVRKEHEDIGGKPVFDGDGDFMMQYGDDDMGPFPETEADSLPLLPLMSGALGRSDQPYADDSSDHVRAVGPPSALSGEPTSISLAAPQKQRKPKGKKKLAFDKFTEVGSELRDWQRDYVAMMTAATIVRANSKAASHANGVAFHFVYGSGLNGVGDGIGSSKFASPLETFSGAPLLEKVMGEILGSARPKKGKKRASTDDENGDLSPNKRIRDFEVGRGDHSNQHFDGDGFVFNMDEDRSIEVGRDAPSALPDHPSSALMPWNVSASLHSHQRGASSSVQRRAGVPGSQLGSIGARRLTSASPLIARGSNVPGDLSQFNMKEDYDAPTMYGREDDFGSQFGAGGAIGGASSSQAPAGLRSLRSQTADDFEIFGQAANVDTQTAAISQWVRDALDRESNNFFEYVMNTIAEKRGDKLVRGEGDVSAGRELGDESASVGFEELFLPETNSRVVAAQAFYHILCLATKHRVWVDQEEFENMEPFGEIRIGVVV